MTVLVLDGNQRSALASVRSLGARGISVVVGEETPASLAGASRYAAAAAVYPSPYTAPAAFVAALARIIAERGVTELMPMTEVATELVIEHRTAWPQVATALPTLSAFRLLSDKYRLFELAQRLNVPMPATHFIDNPAQAHALAATLTYPVVLKPYRSRIRVGDAWLTTAVRYAHSAAELRQRIAAEPAFAAHRFLIQEYIAGHGAGVFALYRAGEPLALFSHKRLREKPPSGGVSVWCESAAVPPRLRAAAETLLGHVGWHGAAMVEFKVAADGTPYLIEVNARLWGSLQLAIDAGVDFPYLLYRLARGEPLAPVADYRVGTRSRWLLGDLDHLYLTLKGTAPLAHKLATLLAVANPWPRRTRYEINRWGDLRPFALELRRYLGLGD